MKNDSAVVFLLPPAIHGLRALQKTSTYVLAFCLTIGSLLRNLLRSFRRKLPLAKLAACVSHAARCLKRKTPGVGPAFVTIGYGVRLFVPALLAGVGVIPIVVAVPEARAGGIQSQIAVGGLRTYGGRGRGERIGIGCKGDVVANVTVRR